VLLLLLVGTLEIAGVPPVGAASTALTAALAATGYGGFALVALGTLGLLARRIGSPGLRKYSGVPEYLNLVVVFSVALSVVAIQATRDPLFATTCAFVTSLMAFRPQPADMGLAQMVEMGLGAFLVAYVPLTRMSHFVAKYFLYHDVRWHDEPNRPGSRIEARVKQALDFGVSWDAPHIPKNKKWGQVVTESER
jgi:nitrate reductase gamma subunit